MHPLNFKTRAELIRYLLCLKKNTINRRLIPNCLDAGRISCIFMETVRARLDPV